MILTLAKKIRAASVCRLRSARIFAVTKKPVRLLGKKSITTRTRLAGMTVPSAILPRRHSNYKRQKQSGSLMQLSSIELGDEQLMVVHRYDVATLTLLLLCATCRLDRHVRGYELVDFPELRWGIELPCTLAICSA